MNALFALKFFTNFVKESQERLLPKLVPELPIYLKYLPNVP